MLEMYTVGKFFTKHVVTYSYFLSILGKFKYHKAQVNTRIFNEMRCFFFTRFIFCSFGIKIMITSLVIISLQIFTTRGELIKDPTLKPADPFSASADAGVFEKELQHSICINRDKIADIWFHRTHEQRMQTNDFYVRNFCPIDRRGYYYSPRCPLRAGLKDISDGSMDDLYSDSLLSSEILLGQTVYEAIIGKWKEKGSIELILCGDDQEMKDRIAQFYISVYQNTVENHLAIFRKEDQDYQHIMQKYCWRGLCQDKKIKPEDADKEAQALAAIDPCKDKEGFKNKLNELLDKNCEPDMKMILEKYRQNKNDIVDAVEKAFDGRKAVERAYNRLVRYIENTCQFYADELHNAVDGCGTDTDKINRIILTRCERDLACILNKYKEIHGETFTNRLKMDTTEHRYLTSIRYLCGKT